MSPRGLLGADPRTSPSNPPRPPLLRGRLGALSVLACKTLVEQWLEEVQSAGGVAKTYVDDRYIIARDRETFDLSAGAGFRWEDRMRWKTNIDKSYVASSSCKRDVFVPRSPLPGWLL